MIPAPEPNFVSPQAASRATLMLASTTILWGLSFTLLKQWETIAQSVPAWQELNQPAFGGLGLAVGSLLAACTIIAIRMVLAILVLGVFDKRLLFHPTRSEHWAGMVIGVLFWSGSTLQLVGLAFTTPSVSAFVTSLGSAWVPVLAYLFYRHQITGAMLAGFGLGLAGTLIMSGLQGPTGGKSDLLGAAFTLVASLIFAWQILVLDRWGKRHRSAHFTLGMLGTGAVCAALLGVNVAALGPGLDVLGVWLVQVLHEPVTLMTIALLTILCTVLPFHWMNVYQPQISPTRAALIYLAEPLFAAAFSIAWGWEHLTASLALGGAMILAGNLLAEMPKWWRRGR